MEDRSILLALLMVSILSLLAGCFDYVFELTILYPVLIGQGAYGTGYVMGRIE